MKQTIGALAVLGVASVAGADQLAPVSLTLDVASSMLAAVQEPVKEGEKAGAAPVTGEKSQFGEAVKEKERTWFLTVGAGIAPGGDDGTHADLFVAASTFIGTGLEIQLEASGWYFDQDPDSTAGGGFTVHLRWHCLHGAYGGGGGEGNDWTVFVDAGIGLIVSGDDVPSGGSSVNLAPRVGAGATFRLGESSTRLVGGIRWHHMSNARTSGDTENPDFNAPMFYIGVEWPI